jgi:hypothetical protein
MFCLFKQNKKRRRPPGRKCHGKTMMRRKSCEVQRVCNVFRVFIDCVYYETIKRELNRSLIYECRCDERLKAKAEGSTRLVYTGLCGGLEHLKIETSFI